MMNYEPNGQIHAQGGGYGPPGGFGGPPPGGFGAPPGGFGGPPPGAPPGGFGAPAPAGGPAPYGAPPAGGLGPKKNSTLAIVSLVSAIVGWFFCYGIGPIVAIVTGMMAKKEIKANPDTIQGGGLATAGIVIGAINLALSVIGAIIWVLMMVLKNI